MPKQYSGWTPKTRDHVEQMIVEALTEHQGLTVVNMRAHILRRNHIPKNLSLAHKSLAQICRSLRLRGILVNDHPQHGPKHWSLAVKAT